LAPPGDHADLQGEEFVVGQATDGRVALGEVIRVVGRRHGGGDGWLSADDLRRQVLGVRPEAVQAAPDGLTQCPRRNAAREPVDGHDAAHMEQRPAVVALEVGVVQLGTPALQLDLAARDHGVAGLELPLDEAAPEPDGLYLATVVLERRRR
jgi:hypothetical protein